MEFLDLGEDAISCILDYLNWRSLKNLSQTCSQLFQMTRNKIGNSATLKFDARETQSRKEYKNKISDLPQLARKYKSCKIKINSIQIRNNKRAWNLFLKKQMCNMDSIQFGGTLKLVELFGTMSAFNNVTNLKLSNIALLNDPVIFNSLAPADLSKLESLELTFFKNLPFNWLKNCQKLKSLAIGGIRNTNTPVFNIVEFLQQQTELESLTIFDVPGEEMFFLETDISCNIKFQLKRFILIQSTLRSKANLLKFLESQKKELKTLALIFCDYVEYYFIPTELDNMLELIKREENFVKKKY